MVEQVDPENIRILWWDTGVAKEQVIGRDKSSKIAHLVEAAGGGGTHMGCVSEYIVAKGYKPECVVVFTDGYVEDKVQWKVNVPTLVVVDGNRRFVAPAGVRVVFK
jgi:predicted metal-dependent peptidase